MKKNIFYFIALIAFTFTACKQEKKEAVKSEEETTTVASKETPPQKSPSFKYEPQKPVNGKLNGVVELGASGFNSFIVDIDKDNNWEVKKKEFGNSLILEGMTNSNEVSKKLKLYIQEILEFGVDSKDIHFVISSGAVKSDISQTIIKELKTIGYMVNIVTPQQEGIYALKSVLPNRFTSIAYVVDIGSGNTKISYHDGKKIVSAEGYGSKYFQQNIEDKKVYDNTRSISSGIPKGRQSLCFIIGGVPYQMAKKLRKDEERFTMLNADIKTYDDLVKTKGKKLESGLNIFKAISDETNCKRFVFDWDANFTIGFLLSLPKK